MVPQCGRRRACSAPFALEKGGQLAHHPTCQQVIDGPGELMGQDRARLARAGCWLASGERLRAGGVSPQEADRRFRAGPWEIGRAKLRARGPGAVARRGFGTRAQTAGGDQRLDPGDTREGMEFIPQAEAQDLANPRQRLEAVYRLGLVRLGGGDDGARPVAAQRGNVAKPRPVPFHALLPCSVGTPRRDARAVGFGGQLVPDRRQVVLAMRLLAVAPQLRPLPGEIPAASTQGAGGAHLRGIDIRLRAHPAPEPDGDLVCLNRIVVGLAPGDRLPVERVPEHARNPLLSAEVRAPVPGKATRDGHAASGALRCHRPEACLWTGLHVLMAQDLPSRIQDADRHAAGLQSDAARRVVRLGVQSPAVASSGDC
jgi:hypothetical protein